MFDRRRVTKALAELGFISVGPLQYELKAAEPSIRKYLSFRLLGVYRWEVDGYVGFVHDQAEAFAAKCLHDFGGSWWQWALTKKELPFTALARIGKVAR